MPTAREYIKNISDAIRKIDASELTFSQSRALATIKDNLRELRVLLGIDANWEI